MKYRNFGSTGLKVSEIGFGGWGIGGNNNNAKAYGPTNNQESILALKTAFDKGINFFDTSPLYGFGQSEILIGQTFKSNRDKVIIVTKVGYTDYLGNQNFSLKYIKKSLEDSLKRLETDYVDIFQLHDLPIEFINNSSEVSDILLDLKKEGKIRFLGISTKNQEDSKKIIDKRIFDCMQINFNLLDQRAIKNRLFKKCKDHKIAIIGRTPLCFGFLTGKYNSKSLFHKDDHRSRWSKKQIDLWSSAYKLFLNNLKNIDKQNNSQISLRFCLSFPEISTVIPGMLNNIHVEENVLSSELGKFSVDIVNKFQEIYNQNNFFIR
jgi:aryl-alcohol dehydrogenase-like predicted oxidoreductase|tara:strand:- start:11 stop:973 length:963 start_codon:yes stop_codon:yes gene_type:complete